MFKTVRDTCINQLESIVDEATMEECHRYIERRREQRHQKTKERHLSKFYRLCHDQRDGCSNPRHGRHGNFHTCIDADTTQSDTCTNNNYDASSTPNFELRSQKTSNNNSNNNQGCWVRNFSKTPPHWMLKKAF